MHEKILIFDFGSQYTMLIARKIREQNVFCEIVGFDYYPESWDGISGIVLSGGPASVYGDNSPRADERLWNAPVPVLAICYGMHLVTKRFGGNIQRGKVREYGSAMINVDNGSVLYKGMEEKQQVWMSHSDVVLEAPGDFKVVASSENNIIASLENEKDKIYAVQFHPEVKHTCNGRQLLNNFLFSICRCRGDWKMGDFINEQIEKIKKRTAGKQVILGISGGVDSSVAAALIYKAIGDRLTCFFIDNGLLRKEEMKRVEKAYKDMGDISIEYVDESELFLSRLKGVGDPEKKRKIIGGTFIEVFEKQLRGRYEDAAYLAQGTLYPDVIESVSHKGPSATIKTHHNVGGLPDDMKLELIEPFRELFKDEVRKVGKQLNVPEEIINRHPFPGPGLGVRVLGEVDKEKLDILREADDIFISALKDEGYYSEISQALAVLLPVKSVGVMGDERTYQFTAVLRAVVTTDFMTADIFDFPTSFLKKISSRIINSVDGVNRVTYDISTKPPATIEWE